MCRCKINSAFTLKAPAFSIEYLRCFMQVTTEVLVSTQAGKKLKRLTKHTNTAVAQAAAATVAAWKTAVTQEIAADQNGAAAGAATCSFTRTPPLHACCPIAIPQSARIAHLYV